MVLMLCFTAPLPPSITQLLETGFVAMAKDPLAEAGLHFDELNKLRILEPEVDQKTTELKEECEDFVDSKSIPFSVCSVSQMAAYSLYNGPWAK